MDVCYFDIYVAWSYTFHGTVAVPTTGDEPAGLRAAMKAASIVDLKVRDIVALESSHEMYLRRGI